MYTGRARVLTPKGFTKPKAQGAGEYNSGLDSYLFTQIQSTDPEKQQPIPLQFDLRSADWTAIRDMLVQNIAINTGLNLATIASFLNDSNAAKTAREISTEEDETAGFVNEKRALIEKPINRILKMVTRYEGFTDEVVIRWSAAGLTNRAVLAEILSIALAGRFISQKKAVEMFNYDDDDEQVQSEYNQILKESKDSAFGNMDFGEGDVLNGTAGGDNTGSANGYQGGGQGIGVEERNESPSEQESKQDNIGGGSEFNKRQT